MKQLKFSLDLAEIEVVLDDVSYRLRELSGKQRDAYMDDMNKRMKYVNGNAEGLTKYADLQAGLVSKCLLDSEGTNVPISTIQSWPANVVTSLFNKAQEMSGLNEEGIEKVKND